MSNLAKYQIGQIIYHRLFHYRGVIIDVDPSFQNTEEWYAIMAKSNPNKQQPWYHVLVDNTEYVTYVAEQNLEQTEDDSPINHPEVEKHFQVSNEGKYQIKKSMN